MELFRHLLTVQEQKVRTDSEVECSVGEGEGRELGGNISVLVSSGLIVL